MDSGLITTQTGHLGHTVTTINAASDGPSLVVLGSIHGNEPCGTFAIRKLIQKFSNRDLVLQCGSVTFIPECNRQAFEENKRSIDINLNRIFKPHETPRLLEEHYASFLAPFVNQADYLIDLHSTSAGGDPFIFDDIGSPETKNMALSLGLPYILQGWPDLYQDDTNHMDTLLYAASCNVAGILVECGQHHDPKSVDIAEQSIIKAMQFLGLLPPANPNAGRMKSKLLRVYQVIYKDSDDFQWLRPLYPYEPVRAGEVLARTKNGDIIIERNSVIVMPDAGAQINEESFYLAREGAD